MLKQSCLICKIVGLFAIVGALNWGLIAVSDLNLVEKFFGVWAPVTRVIYALVGLSGLMLLASYFVICPACKK